MKEGKHSMKFFRKGTALMLAFAVTFGMSESAVLAANADAAETADIVEETPETPGEQQAVQEGQQSSSEETSETAEVKTQQEDLVQTDGTKAGEEAQTEGQGAEDAQTADKSQAAEDSQTGTKNQETEDSQTGTEIQGTENIQAEVLDQTAEASQGEAAEDAQAETSGEQAAAPEDVQEEAAGAAPASMEYAEMLDDLPAVAHDIEYIYVDEETVALPGTQNIAIGFVDDSLMLEDAVLYGTSDLTGETMEWQAAALAGNNVLFTMEYTEAQSQDVIRLTKLAYHADGIDYLMEFQDQGIEASYQVGGTEAAARAASASPEEETPAVAVYALDENGEQVQASSDTAEEAIGEALTAAEGTEAVPALAKSTKSKSTGVGKRVIFICAGHDSTHTGAYGNGLHEEQLTFKVAKYCKEALEKYPGVEVYMDRNSVDCKYPGKGTAYCLEQRVKDAAALGATTFIDIHFNSSNGSAYGAEVYYPNKSYSQNIHKDGETLANEILSNLEALGLYNRGAKVRDCTTNDRDENGNLEDYYTSINMAKARGMTGLIVEHAFLDNAGDALKLSQESFLKKLGQADAEALADHYNLRDPMGFEDVREEDWYYDMVSYVYDEGIMTGMRGGYFGAVETIDRSQFVTTLYRMEGEPKVKSGKKFPDVPENMFFTDAVKWASENGIVTGYTEGAKKGKFGPQDKITREQMATMFYRYAKYKGYDTSTSDKWKNFPDDHKVTKFAQTAMAWAVKNGMITGDQGKLNPQTNVSRAVAATLIQRFLTEVAGA